MADLLKENGEYDQASKYYHMILKFYQEGNEVGHMHYMNINISLAECYRRNKEKQKAHEMLENIRKTYSDYIELNSIFGLCFIKDFISEYYEFFNNEEAKVVPEEIKYCHKTLNEAKNVGERLLKETGDIMVRIRLIDIYKLLVRIKRCLGYTELSESLVRAVCRKKELEQEIR